MDSIRTPRLRLRPLGEGDLYSYYTFARSEAVGPNAGWKPVADIEEARALLELLIERDTTWAIEENETERFMGTITLTDDKHRHHALAREIGFALHPAFWGRGYMTEAVLAVLSYAFDILQVEIVGIDHYPRNERSRKVIEKCGFRYEGTLRRAFVLYDGTVLDHVCYSMTKEEYKERPQV